MINVKHELDKMQKHRESYYPALQKMLVLYEENKHENRPVQLRDDPQILIILELRDIGYIEQDALVVKKTFNTISAVWYNGDYPLTDKGDAFIVDNDRKRTGYGLKYILISAGIIAVIIILLSVLYKSIFY